MNGRVVGIFLIACAALAGAALYYLQIYAFYRDVPDSGTSVRLATLDGGTVPLDYSEFQAIDANSSPIRYRACFRTSVSETDQFVPVDTTEPRNAPGWFGCFDAKAIAEKIESGAAKVYLAEKNIAYGVDRIVALTSDGWGYVWHELNDCGEKSYDGTVVGEACPEREEGS